jgi:hypothetical protein
VTGRCRRGRWWKGRGGREKVREGGERERGMSGVGKRRNGRAEWRSSRGATGRRRDGRDLRVGVCGCGCLLCVGIGVRGLAARP